MEGRLHSFDLRRHRPGQPYSLFINQQQRHLLSDTATTDTTSLSASPGVLRSAKEEDDLEASSIGHILEGSYAVERLLQQQTSNAADAKPTISPALLSAVNLVSSNQEAEALHRRQQEQLEIAQRQLALVPSSVLSSGTSLLRHQSDNSLIGSPQPLPVLLDVQHRVRNINPDRGPPLPQLNSLVRNIDRRLGAVHVHCGEAVNHQQSLEETRIGIGGNTVISPTSLSSSPSSCAAEQRGDTLEADDRLSYQVRTVSPLRGRGRPSAIADPSLDGSPRQHPCPECGKAFPNNSALVKHRLIHSDERNFICNICQKAFKRQDHLNGHLNVHKTVKPFPCVIGHCDKSYCDARSLRRHLEHSHSIQNPVVHSSKGTVYIKCDDLEATVVPSRGGEEFNQPVTMAETSSSSTVPGQEVQSDPDTYGTVADSSCDELQSITSPATAVDGQCRRPSSKPVECTQCGRTFKNMPALNGHMRLHSTMIGRGETTQTTFEDMTSSKTSAANALLFATPTGTPAMHESDSMPIGTASSRTSGNQQGVIGHTTSIGSSSSPFQQQLQHREHNRESNYNYRQEFQMNDPGGPGLLMYAPSQQHTSMHHHHQPCAYHVSDAQVQTAYDFQSPMSSRPPSHSSGQTTAVYLPGDGTHRQDGQEHDSGHNSGYSDTDLLTVNAEGTGENVLSGTNDPTMISPHLASLNSLEVSASPDLSFRVSAASGACVPGVSVPSSMVSMLSGGRSAIGCGAGRPGDVDSGNQQLVDFGFPPSYTGSDMQSSMTGGDRLEVHESHPPLNDNVGPSCHMEGPLDLGPDLSKDVDDELIQKELLSFMRFPGSNDGFNPFVSDDDEILFSCPNKLTERKRHMTAPSALAAGGYSSIGCNYPGLLSQVGNNLYNYQQHHQQQQSSSSSLSGYTSPRPCHFGANDQSYETGITTSSRQDGHDPLDTFMPSSSSVNAHADNGQGRNVSNVEGRHNNVSSGSGGKKSRPASRQRRKSRGKPDNVFMLLKSVGLRRSFNLPISPPRFRKQSAAAAETSRKFSIGGGGGGGYRASGTKCHHKSGGGGHQRHGTRPKPAPIIIPRASLNRFHSQLRSPRLWTGGGLSSACSEYTKRAYRTPTPYTPPPILSPVRHGSGLFWTISKALATLAGPKSAPISPRFGRGFWPKVVLPSEAQGESITSSGVVGDCGSEPQVPSGTSTRITSPLDLSAIEEADEPPATDTTPHINIGPNYQADIPDIISDGGVASGEFDRADLLYCPSKCNQLDDIEVDAFCKVASSSVVSGAGRNIEYALHLLCSLEGDLERAYFSLLSSVTGLDTTDPSDSGVNRSYEYVDTCLWSCQEIVRFQDAILKHDKDFYIIASAVETKSVKQCVQFYYTWKKMCTDEYKRLRAARRRRILPAMAMEPNIYDLRSLGPIETIVPSAAVGSPLLGVDQRPDHEYDSVIQTNPVSEETILQPDFNDYIGTDRNEYEPTNKTAFDHNVDVLPKVYSSRQNSPATDAGSTTSDAVFPCRLCGKVFYKVKSRNAHMKSHSVGATKKGSPAPAAVW